MGIELRQPAFVMKIKNIEEGSPAAATGKLSKGQIIQTINGEKLADIDPRIQLGRIIADAEATDGIIKFMVKDRPKAKAEEVVVKIPVLGAYSKTWPLDCPKSDRIVRGFANYLAKPDSNKGFGGIGMLFLLSTGEDKDLEPVRQWARGLAGKRAPTYAWHLGYGRIPLTEYYLRTGDRSALPTIQKWVDSAAKGQYLGGWAGRGGVAHVTYGGGGGHLNAGGTAVVTFLRYGSRAVVTMPPVPQGIFSLWLEEMKLPSLGDEALRKSATVIPMLSSQWQKKQDPDNRELQSEDDRFRWDGTFVANPKVLGAWRTIDVVQTIDEFTADKKTGARRAQK